MTNTIAIVGNGRVSTNYSDIIDNCDYVIRFNNIYCQSYRQHLTGRKFDIYGMYNTKWAIEKSKKIIELYTPKEILVFDSELFKPSDISLSKAKPIKINDLYQTIKNQVLNDQNKSLTIYFKTILEFKLRLSNCNLKLFGCGNDIPIRHKGYDILAEYEIFKLLHQINAITLFD